MNKIELLDEVKKKAFNSVKLKIKLVDLDENLVLKLEEIINRYNGNSNIEFMIEDELLNQNLKLFSKKSKVAVDDAFLLELNKLVNIKYDLA